MLDHLILLGSEPLTLRPGCYATGLFHIKTLLDTVIASAMLTLLIFKKRLHATRKNASAPVPALAPK